MLQDVMKNISKMPQIEFPLYSFVSLIFTGTH